MCAFQPVRAEPMAAPRFICTCDGSSASLLRSLTQTHDYSLLQIRVSNQRSIWGVIHPHSHVQGEKEKFLQIDVKILGDEEKSVPFNNECLFGDAWESQLLCICGVGVCVFVGVGGYPHEYCWKGIYSTVVNSRTTHKRSKITIQCDKFWKMVYSQCVFRWFSCFCECSCIMDVRLITIIQLMPSKAGYIQAD